MIECDPAEQRKRVAFLNHLYEQSGRDDLPVGHPFHKTYTGLWQEFVKQTADEARNTWWEANHG